MSLIAIDCHWLSFAVKQIVSINYLSIIPAIRPALVLHVVVFYCPGLLPLIREISNMSRAILTINQVTVKGYHECPFAVEVGERFIAQKKRGDRGNALKVIDDRGQLGHLQRELLSLLWPLKNEIVV